MKLAFFDDYRLGVVKGDAIHDVSAVARDIPHVGPGDLISSLIARFGDYRAGWKPRPLVPAHRWQTSASGRRCPSRATSSAWR